MVPFSTVLTDLHVDDNAFPPSYDLTIGTLTKSTDLIYKTVKKYSSHDIMLLRLTLADFFSE
jgi:hypothetical protein